MVPTEKKYKDSNKLSMVVRVFASLLLLHILTFVVLYYEKEEQWHNRCSTITDALPGLISQNMDEQLSLSSAGNTPAAAIFVPDTNIVVTSASSGMVYTS